MYIPPSFHIEDRALLQDFIDRFNFGVLVTAGSGAPFASHLPFLVDRERNRLLAHVARANPHWKLFDGAPESLAIFSGPHAYISPGWYAAGPAVPTWNYTAVHVYGAPRVLTDDASLDRVLDLLVEKHEVPGAGGFFKLPADYREKHKRAIVGFEMPIARMEGKFKLGQNRSREDQDGMMRGLLAGDAGSRDLAAFITGPFSSTRA